MFELTLKPLCTFTFQVSEMIAVGRGPFGTRGIGELVGGRLNGERIHADQLGRAAADWALISDDGFVRGDIRAAWRTDDGANLYMNYVTFMDTGAPAYACVEFETGDDRYGWLNRSRVVGKGAYAHETNTVNYQLFTMH